jgi:hypothetical protein
LVVLSVLAVAAAGAAFFSAFGATLTFFGEQPSARESAIAGQAARTLLWAVATPFCGRAVLRRGREAVLGAVIWLGLFVACTPWWWPGPPGDDLDVVQPLWHSSLMAWSLVAAGLAVGLFAAWRDLRPRVRAVAVAVAVGVVVLSAASYINLEHHADAEADLIRERFDGATGN